jgi:hypothetical protein
VFLSRCFVIVCAESSGLEKAIMSGPEFFFAWPTARRRMPGWRHRPRC